MPAGGAGGDLAALDEGYPEPPQDQVVGERAPGPAAADDDDVSRGS